MATNKGWFSNILPAITQIPGNALNDAGNILNGVMQIPQAIDNAVANPKTILPSIGNIGTGFANEMNQFAGDPIHNMPLIGIQTPQQSVAQSAATLQHAQQHPLNTALDAATLIQVGNAFNPDKSSSIGKAIEKTGNSMTNDVNKIQLKPSLSGAAKEQAVQDTVNNVVPGATAEEKYANLLPTMKKLGDSIDQELKDNPKSVPIEDVKNAFMGNLSDQFRTKSLTSEVAKTEINDYINNLFKDTAEPVPLNTSGAPVEPINPADPSTTIGTTVNGSKFVRMGGVKPGEAGPPGYLKEISTGLPPIGNESNYAVENPSSPYNPKPMNNIVPQDVSTKDLFDMKVGANQDYQGVLKKLSAGIPLTDTDKVMVAARKTLDDIIAYEHPNVKTMTLQQSNLYDAIKPLASARNANHSFNLLGTTVPSGAAEFLKSKAGSTVSNAGKIISKLNPERSFIAAGQIANAMGKSGSSLTPQNIGDKGHAQQDQNTPDHTNSIAPDVNSLPQNADSVPVAQDGTSAITNPYTSGLAIDQLTYKSQNKQLNAQLAAYQQQEGKDVYHPRALAADQANIKAVNTQLSNLEANNTTSRTLDDPYNNALKIVSGTKNTLADLNKSGSNLFESNGTINDTVYKTDPNYSQLVSSIDYLQKQSGMIVYMPGISSQALKSNILQAEKLLLYNTYYSKLGGSYAGGTSNLLPVQDTSTSSFTPTSQLPPVTSTPTQSGQESTYQFMAPNPGWGSMPAGE